MLKKIITKNVGVLRAFDTPGAPQLAKLTAIYARNGRGKTTLSSVLRASALGNDSIVLGRRTLGSSAPPEVTLLFDGGGNVRFTGGAWTGEAPIEVFDSAFIAENLYAGEKIDLDHDRKLFTVILGRQGVKLARQQEFFNGTAKAAAAKLKEAEAALANDIPADMTREEFLGFAPGPALDEQIEQAQKDLKAVQQSARLSTLRLFQHITAPTLSIDVRAILASTVDDIQATARDRLAEHFKLHKLGREGEQWVRYGRDHIVDDECPFCGREGVDELGLVKLYDQIFGESYQTHLATVRAAADEIERELSPEARERLLATVAANGESVLQWAEYCNLDKIERPDPAANLSGKNVAYLHLKRLFDQKRQTPLAVITDEEAVAEAEKEIANFAAVVAEFNTAVDAMNVVAQARRSGPQPSEAQARAKVDNLGKRARRTDPGVQARIDAMLAAKKRDARARKVRTVVQARLKKANETAAEHYHDRVNHYLERFAATFRISKITNSMAGNLGSIDYGLIVRGHPVGRGRKDATDAEPTFKNTLSTGDKATLAFAFFLAGLDRDAGLTSKTIVFDDPLSSHDTHRQWMTIEIITALCEASKQLIVLSHDAEFLRGVLDRCPARDRITLEIAFEGPDQWSRANVADIDDLCRTAHQKNVDLLSAFVDHRAGDPTHVAPAVRKVLETHYRRTYPAYFERSDWLGTIISKIRAEGPTHPCYADLAVLEGCNAATKDEHHGDDADVAPAAPIDGDGLAVAVGDCLALINVVRRPASTAAAAAAPLVTPESTSITAAPPAGA